MIISRLAGIFTGAGFRSKSGRRPLTSDTGFLPGPLDIIVEGGKIQSIRPSEHGVRGDYLGEGLFCTAAWADSHTHALFGGHRSREYFLRWAGASYPEIAAQGGGIHNTIRDTLDVSEVDLIELLSKRAFEIQRGGTTSLEVKTGYAPDPAGELRLLRTLKDAKSVVESRSGPRIFRTFLPLHALPKGVAEKEFVDAMSQLLPTVASESLADATDAFPEKGFFSLDECIRYAMVARANKMDLKIHADEISPMGATEAFAGMGALSVDHLQKVSKRGLEVLDRTQTVATLLPATSFFLGLEYAPARQIIEAGARFALATDYNPGTAPVSSFRFSQLLAASQMKLSPAEILCASTYGGAAALGWDSQLGTLEPGFCADLLLWRPTSLSDSDSWLEELFLSQEAPIAVFQNGELVAES